MKTQQSQTSQAGAAFATLASKSTKIALSAATFRGNEGVDASNGAHDFDFYFGRWQVHNERLTERLVGSSDWEHFEAIQQCRPLIDGYGNIDDFVTGWSGGFKGMTLRLFNRETRQWSIYWASNQTGVLEPPVVGFFENGVGRFFGHDDQNGRPVLARFVWSDITAISARWEQALSTDDGTTWETNWRMHMTRIGHSTNRGRWLRSWQ